MSTDLTALYRRWITEVWERGDTAVSAELIDDDLVDHDAVPGMPSGRAGHDATCAMIRTAFPDARYAVDAVLADGDLVAGRWTMTGTHLGPLAAFGLPATGRPVRMNGMEIFRVREGRFVELWHQEGVLALLGQLGANPVPAPATP